MKCLKIASTILALLQVDLASASFKCPKTLKRNGCLVKDDVDSILSRYIQVFDISYGGHKLQELINCTMAKDFKAYDKTFTYGQGGNGLLTKNRGDLISQQQFIYNTRFMTPTAAGGEISKIFSFHSCDRIAFRYKFSGKTSGKTKCTNTVNTRAGDPIVYYGTSLLKMADNSMMVEEVITSADWGNQFQAIGANFDGSPICPGTTAAPCDTDCGNCSGEKFVPKYIYGPPVL